MNDDDQKPDGQKPDPPGFGVGSANIESRLIYTSDVPGPHSRKPPTAKRDDAKGDSTNPSLRISLKIENGGAVSLPS